MRNVIDLRSRKSVRRDHTRVKQQGRRSPLRVRRRRRLLVYSFLAIFALFGVAAGASALTYHPRLTVDSLEITGLTEVPQRLVRAYAEVALRSGAHPFISNENIFLYPKAAIAESLTENIPRIKSASVARSSLLAQAVRITVEERQEKALWCNAATCAFMDESGFIFAPAPLDLPLVRFFGGLERPEQPIGQTFLKNDIGRAFELLSRLEAAGYRGESFRMADASDFEIRLKDSFVVKGVLSADPSLIVKNLELVLSSSALRGRQHKLDYIDLRFGNRIYYKFQGKPVSEIE